MPLVHHNPPFLDNGRSSLMPGALPSLNLPKKSIPSSSKIPNPRKSSENIFKKREASKNHIPDTTPKDTYKSYAEFCSRVYVLNLPLGWQLSKSEEFLQSAHYDNTHLIPKFEVLVDQNLNYILRVFGWKIKSTLKM